MKDKILEWKAKYGAVYSISIEEQQIYYRSLNGWEVQSVLELQQNKKADLDIEVAMCAMAIIYPSPIPSFAKPGSIARLSSEIWDKSFPTEQTLPNITAKAREWATKNMDANFSIALSSILCKVMPSLDFAHLMDLPLSKLIKIAAIVEDIAGVPILNKDDAGIKTSASVQDGYGVSQDDANKASHALSSALKNLKK